MKSTSSTSYVVIKAVPRFKSVNCCGKLSFKIKVKENELKLTIAEKQLHQETIKELTGRAKRLYMARVAQTWGRGGPSLLNRELGWSRDTIRKGFKELSRGLICYDNYAARGRKRAEDQLPNLLSDMRAMADQHSQTDPSFESSRLYLRLSAASVRSQLIEQKGYSDEALPSEEVIRQRLNELGYTLKAVKKANL